MIKTIVKREVLSYLKNPIYYIGGIVVFISVYLSLSPYLNIHHFTDASEIRTLSNHAEISDADIMVGYIPTTTEEQYEMGLDKIKSTMIENFDMSLVEANALILKLKKVKCLF